MYAKSQYDANLTPSIMVAEQEAKLSIFLRFFAILKKSVEIETKL